MRVLQLGEFERVGGTSTIKTDVRLVAATNRNLEESVANGDFGADLYFRISVVPIFVPPLRARKGDIPLLAGEFLQRFNAEHDANLSLTASAMQVLTSCHFPGNVRELENCIRRTATLANADGLVADDFRRAARMNVCRLFCGGSLRTRPTVSCRCPSVAAHRTGNRPRPPPRTHRRRSQNQPMLRQQRRRRTSRRGKTGRKPIGSG